MRSGITFDFPLRQIIDNGSQRALPHLYLFISS